MEVVFLMHFCYVHSYLSEDNSRVCEYNIVFRLDLVSSSNYLFKENISE